MALTACQAGKRQAGDLKGGGWSDGAADSRIVRACAEDSSLLIKEVTDKIEHLKKVFPEMLNKLTALKTPEAEKLTAEALEALDVLDGCTAEQSQVRPCLPWLAPSHRLPDPTPALYWQAAGDAGQAGCKQWNLGLQHVHGSQRNTTGGMCFVVVSCTARLPRNLVR